MTDAKADGVRRQTGRRGFTTDANHPLPQWPMAHVHPDATKAAVADGTERDDAVMQLARALRTAERAHCAYVAELRLNDVKPAEEWSTWYAEYLLGLR